MRTRDIESLDSKRDEVCSTYSKWNQLGNKKTTLDGWCSSYKM